MELEGKGIFGPFDPNEPFKRPRKRKQQEVKSDVEPYIATYTGKVFHPISPNPDEVDILDIAHALSNQCRFTGHTTAFYSVAQHCVLVSEIVPEELALTGLLHDASEAYVADINKPAKTRMPEYQQIEGAIQDAIFTHFGLPVEMPKAVKDADLRLLRTEARDLMKGIELFVKTEHIEPLPDKIKPWPPTVARNMYLKRYAELTGENYMKLLVEVV